jgi:hypothetical protein
MRHILRFRVFEVMDSPPQWRIDDLCKSIGLDYPDYAINHDLTVAIRGEDWDEGDLTKVRDAGGSWDKAKGKFVDQSGSVVDPRTAKCKYCREDIPAVRQKLGYVMCVKCAQSTEKSLKNKEAKGRVISNPKMKIAAPGSFNIIRDVDKSGLSEEQKRRVDEIQAQIGELRKKKRGIEDQIRAIEFTELWDVPISGYRRDKGSIGVLAQRKLDKLKESLDMLELDITILETEMRIVIGVAR